MVKCLLQQRLGRKNPRLPEDFSLCVNLDSNYEFSSLVFPVNFYAIEKILMVFDSVLALSLPELPRMAQ